MFFFFLVVGDTDDLCKNISVLLMFTFKTDKSDLSQKKKKSQLSNEACSVNIAILISSL